MKTVLIILFIICLAGCKKIPTPLTQTSWQYIPARDDGQRLNRPLIYRAQVPNDWIRKDPEPSESIVDTTLANCEFFIHDKGQKIRITIHTFPISANGFRIHPQAQISRWKQQFAELDSLATVVKALSYGGFSGLYFEGNGIIDGKETAIMAWSMQLASLYEKQLNQGREPYDLMKCADYTIKISGPLHLMNQHRPSLLAFAQSFELIDELPCLQ